MALKLDLDVSFSYFEIEAEFKRFLKVKRTSKYHRMKLRKVTENRCCQIKIKQVLPT